MIKINDKIIERVEVGNISEAIKFAEEEAGEPNMNMIIAMNKNCSEVFAREINIRSIAARESKIGNNVHVMRIIFLLPKISKKGPTNKVLIKLTIDRGSI